MKLPSLQELLKAGAHFGHHTASWNPKMKPYIFQKKEGVYIIDLQKTREMLAKALNYCVDLSKKNAKIVFVCTKRQGKKIIQKGANNCQMPYVIERWIGGALTNFKTIHQQIKKLKDLEAKKESGQLKKYTKYEQQLIKEEIIKLNYKIGGLKNLDQLPDALLIFDVVNNKSALREARSKKIPVIALVDTNGNPELIDYPVPCNDDAIKVLELMANTFSQAIKANLPTAKKEETNKIKENKIIKK